MTMRRIIGTMGVTLALVVTMATPAAAQSRGDRDSGGRDLGRILYATTNQDLLLNFTERRPDRVVDAQPPVTLEPPDGNPRRAGPEILTTSPQSDLEQALATFLSAVPIQRLAVNRSPARCA
jgi:hypothetical protein